MIVEKMTDEHSALNDKNVLEKKRAYQAAWRREERKKNPEKVREREKAQYQKHKEAKVLRARNYRKNNAYAISIRRKKRWAETAQSRKPQQSSPYITFKGRRLYLEQSPRIGVCNLCRAVVGFDCKLTHMHHEEYDQVDPIKYSIELCARCHRKYHNEEFELFFTHKPFELSSNEENILSERLIGVCSWCRAVKGQINTQSGKLCESTLMHHETYDLNDHLAFTIELCAACHMIYHQKMLKMRASQVP